MRLRRQAATIRRMDIEPRELAEVRSVVRGHMVRGVHLTSNFRDEQVYILQLQFLVTVGRVNRSFEPHLYSCWTQRIAKPRSESICTTLLAEFTQPTVFA